MKRAAKIVSVLLSALTVSAALAPAASALYFSDGAKIWKNTDKTTVVETGDDYIFYDGSWYRKVDADAKKFCETDRIEITKDSASTGLRSTPNPFKVGGTEGSGLYISDNVSVTKNKQPAGTCKASPCLIKSGRYYTRDEAKFDLEKYFDDHSCDVLMYMGEERSFGADARLFSTDPSVVVFDEKTGRLVAKDHGTAEVYVYTTGAIPFYRLDVCVVNPCTPKKNADILYLKPEAWQLCDGEETCISVTSASGKKYDDIRFSVWCGKGYIGEKTGKFAANGNGPVVIRAYSRSNMNVYGEALIYVGSRFSAVSYDGWTKCADGITLKEWSFDCTKPWYVAGWIKGVDEVYIPVVKVVDLTYTDADGNLVDTKGLTGDAEACMKLLRGAYGDKASVREVLDRYYFAKYSKFTPCVPDASDYRNLLFARLIGAIGE